MFIKIFNWFRSISKSEREDPPPWQPEGPNGRILPGTVTGNSRVGMYIYKPTPEQQAEYDRRIAEINALKGTPEYIDKLTQFMKYGINGNPPSH